MLAAGCSRAPDIYQPPIQRKPLTGPEAHLGQFINMNEPMADAYIVRDVSRTTENNRWRWAHRHPQLRFYLRSIDKWKFVLDAGVPDAIFKDIGPVTLTIRINQHELDKLRFEKPGDRHFEKPVPREFLQPGSENFVSIEPDKQWVSKEDGAVLTFVLSAAGFAR
jgi:hypothetical protein